MAENVSTGGNVQFSYQKGRSPEMNKEEKYEISQAYNEYYERKKSEKKRKLLIWIAIASIVLCGIAWLVVRYL